MGEREEALDYFLTAYLTPNSAIVLQTQGLEGTINFADPVTAHIGPLCQSLPSNEAISFLYVNQYTCTGMSLAAFPFTMLKSCILLLGTVSS
jgi:hypothetical protein